MTKIQMNDIKTRNSISKSNVDVSGPYNMARREFFKYAAISGASMLSLFLVNKLTNIKNLTLAETGDPELASKANSLTKDNSLAFTEDNKKVVFYDKKGAELLIFEK